MNDEKFPDRPDHPDFWLISAAVLDLDAKADAGTPFDEITGRMIDEESVTYAALQRGSRAAGRVGSAAAWIDGFLVGMAVQREMSKRGAPSGGGDALGDCAGS